MARPLVKASAPTRRTRKEARAMLRCSDGWLKSYEKRGLLTPYPMGPSKTHQVEYEVADLIRLADKLNAERAEKEERSAPLVVPKRAGGAGPGNALVGGTGGAPLANAHALRAASAEWIAAMAARAAERGVWERETMSEGAARSVLGCDGGVFRALVRANVIRPRVMGGSVAYERDDVLRERDRMLAGKGRESR